MSSNTFLLTGTTGGANNGFWVPAGVAGATNANGVNFTFETFSAVPKRVRLTAIGPLQVSSSGAGYFALTAALPLTVLPTWAYPVTDPSGQNLPQSTTGWLSGPGVQNVTLVTAYANAANLVIKCSSNVTGSQGSFGTAMAFMLEYDAK